MKPSAPIGIFDSGIGGLTVAAAVRQQLPGEDLIYFGDTAHLPYGDKSTAAIQAYSVKIAHLLLEHGVKLVLIACNSASAAAFPLVQAYVGSRALVANVIDPMVQLVAQRLPQARVGLIGTRATVGSGIYAQRLAQAAPGVQLQQLATPLLAPMIEEGFVTNTIAQQVVHTYLQQPQLQGIEALILACTHYPLIAPQINSYYAGQVQVLDSSQVVAQHVAGLLQAQGLLNAQQRGNQTFLVSDYTEAFANGAAHFFGQGLQLQQHQLWE